MAKTADKAKLKLIRAELPPDEHTKLRVLAAKHGLPMSQFVRQLLQKEIKKAGL